MGVLFVSALLYRVHIKALDSLKYGLQLFSSLAGLDEDLDKRHTNKKDKPFFRFIRVPQTT